MFYLEITLTRPRGRGKASRDSSVDILRDTLSRRYGRTLEGGVEQGHLCWL